MRKLTLIASVLCVLGSISLALHYVVIPLDKSFAIAEMTEEPDGLLSAELETPWFLRINKSGLAEMTVTAPDGSSLPQLRTRIALLNAEAQKGFYINRPQIFLHLPAALATSSDAEVEVAIPVKSREFIHKVLLSLALLLGLWLWLKDGLRAMALGQAKAMLWASGGSLAAILAGLWLLLSMQGLAVWLGLALLTCGSLGVLVAVLSAKHRATGRGTRLRELTAGALMVVASTFLCIIAIEGYLSIATESFDEKEAIVPAATEQGEQAWFQLPEDVAVAAASRANALTLPEAWERQPVSLADATSAYNWHGALHIHDVNGFRRLNGPFPDKKPERLRIMVVGDSLTYGYGIAEDWTYSRLLEQALGEDYQVEVINLGRSGYQSTDILNVVTSFAPKLNPDLIVYGVCLNDFLPSGQGQYSGASFPLPEEWKEHLMERTRLAKLANDGYHSLLLLADLKRDFFDDILSQDSGFQERFAQDVAAINGFAEERGLPPVVGIVFHQYFAGDDRAWQLIEAAESSMVAAEFDLISIQPWRTKLEGKNFPVSRWEGHPNELAHSLVAEALFERLIASGRMKSYERATDAAAAGSSEAAN